MTNLVPALVDAHLEIICPASPWGQASFSIQRACCRNLVQDVMYNVDKFLYCSHRTIMLLVPVFLRLCRGSVETKNSHASRHENRQDPAWMAVAICPQRQQVARSTVDSFPFPKTFSKRDCMHCFPLKLSIMFSRSDLNYFVRRVFSVFCGLHLLVGGIIVLTHIVHCIVAVCVSSFSSDFICT